MKKGIMFYISFILIFIVALFIINITIKNDIIKFILITLFNFIGILVLMIGTFILDDLMGDSKNGNSF
jgi:hypothetical protein